MVSWKSPLNQQEIKLWESIKTPSRSGAIIAGYFRKAAGTARATIVLGHPMGKEAKGYFMKNGYTDLLLSNGYNVLVYDMNGFGESTMGNFSYYEDVIAAGLQARALTPGVPIGYFGISLGGQWATIAFADERHPYTFAIIESAATTLDEFWVHFRAAYVVLKILNVLLPHFRKRINMLERIREAKHLQSLLFIYSHADHWTPVSMGERFKRNAHIYAELWTVENARHAMMMKSEHRESYERKIIDFFNRSVSLKNK